MEPNRSLWLSPDADLMDLVADAITSVPSEVAAAGRALYIWRTVDAELLALLDPTGADSRHTLPAWSPPVTDGS